ncbi:hypothetical protein DPMN_134706 [Dreissena polymorpha]|uniref:Uncharacterized protein n=1 Tax=Dreissena polymorpha TaxID=45954 RepID=A0A9D4G0L0_DREPO|nr:hypothetical protein DPMN_134706 [Dreissena polymorpha]
MAIINLSNEIIIIRRLGLTLIIIIIIIIHQHPHYNYIIKTNILTKLHEDWTSNVTCTVFTSFELSQGIIGTNVLTKFHEDRTVNVASRVFTRQMLTHDALRTKGDNKSSP